MADKKSVLDRVTLVLVIVGGVNWGLVGAFNFNLVNVILGSVAWLERLVYVLVGLSALWAIKMATK
ncbi:DUF378 domain-containing protein [Candidatus Woesearchaeota archaeon]|nr:DUF378 domain-containing protein [Candidatus Woesearchaeota archaeon]